MNNQIRFLVLVTRDNKQTSYFCFPKQNRDLLLLFNIKNSVSKNHNIFILLLGINFLTLRTNRILLFGSWIQIGATKRTSWHYCVLRYFVITSEIEKCT